MGEDLSRGDNAAVLHSAAAPSGRITTQQAARALGISPRTVRWHIEHGNLEAVPEGKGVQRTWLISIDSLQAFRDARQTAGDLPGDNRTLLDGADIAASPSGSPIRELADRLAEEAAKAAEYRVRLALTEPAPSTLREELTEARRRREEAERERDELRRRLEGRQEPTGGRESTAEASSKGDLHPQQERPPEEQERPRSWLRRLFGG